MDFQVVNPIDHPGWDDLLLAAGEASFFHTSAWARVLVDSYGYRPAYFAAFDQGRLSALMPFMEISSPWSGRRGVSLPFTDYCRPFGFDRTGLQDAVRAVREHAKGRKWSYVEWRSDGHLPEEAVPTESYRLHSLDLRPDEAGLFSGLRESARRNVRKAAREGVIVEFERSTEALREFYRLQCGTRRRHGLPPQPFLFFKSIGEHVLNRDLGTVASARFGGRVIASSVFFHFGTEAIFKYNASDPRSLARRPNNLILWEAVRWCKGRGATTLNLGRTEADDPGLLRFKRSWGAVESPLIYRRDYLRKRASRGPSRLGRANRRLISGSPKPLLRLLGRLFYKHIG
ncbi:MAG: GNAT family N-acetyltransferase [Candidatus Aminicenantes bacterium]